MLADLRRTSDPYQAAVLAQSLAESSKGPTIDELDTAAEILIGKLEHENSRSGTSAIVQALTALATKLTALGVSFQDQENLAKARQSFEKSLNILQRVVVKDPNNVSLQHDLSKSLGRVGGVLQEQGDLIDARKRFDESLRILRPLVANNPSADLQRELNVTLIRIGDCLYGMYKYEEALRYYRESVAIGERLAASDRRNTEWQWYVSASYRRVGVVLFQLNMFDEALASFEKSRNILQRLVAEAPRSVLFRRNLSATLEVIGDVLQIQNDLSGALARYEEKSKYTPTPCCRGPQ